VCDVCGRFGSADDPTIGRSVDGRPAHARCRAVEMLTRALVLGLTAPTEALAEQCAELGERVRAIYELTPEEIERAHGEAARRIA
jgi:hypothetical protein